MAMPDNAVPNLISAVVCTRNRTESLLNAVESILACDHPNFELIVVDQSTDSSTGEALANRWKDDRLRYIRTSTVGASRARNIGLRAANGSICCFTDDDCTVYPHWLSEFEKVFEQNPSVVIAFCGVDAGSYDTSAGFIPYYERQQDLLVASVKLKNKARGIGAGMAARKREAEALGGYDEMLGPGARFPACEDGDLAVRALLTGHQVYESARTCVTHYGFRTWAEGRELSRRDWLGIGAAYMKPLKCGRWGFIGIPAHEVWQWTILPLLKQIFTLRKPTGIGRLSSFFRGVVQGWRTPVDRTTLLYIDPDKPANPA
jgi:glycosyltransferase involved in cell wall biosynthesis